MLGECWSFPHSSISMRATAALARERNSLVGALATEAVVLHASPGGQIDTLCRDLIARGSIVWTLDLPENAVAVQAGADQPTLRNLHTTGGRETVDLDWCQGQADSQRRSRTITIVTIQAL